MAEETSPMPWTVAWALTLRRSPPWIELSALTVLKFFTSFFHLRVHFNEDGNVAHSCQFGQKYPAAKSLQSCLTLCDPIDGSPPSSPVLGILQARTLEWVAISFSNA